MNFWCASPANCRRATVSATLSALTLVTIPVLAVAAQQLLDLRGIDAVPPIARHEFDVDSKPPGHLPPQGCELPGLVHQYLIAGGGDTLYAFTLNE